jgi:hypothetical protein
VNQTDIIKALINAASYSLVGVFILRMVERVLYKILDKVIDKAFARMRGPASLPKPSEKKEDTR